MNNISFRNKDTNIKHNIICQLSEAVKALQFQARTDDHTFIQSYNDNSDLENSLCTSLEALFLHGIKDSFISRARFVFKGTIDQTSKRPDPSFWPCALVLSHSDTVKTLTNLGQIKNDVGLCRAWIRLALTEGLVSSHLSSLCRDQSTAKSYYRRSAMLMDTELLDVGRRLLDGLESCTTFDLPTNSSLLNSWPEETLILAGISSPKTDFRGVAPAFDIASALDAREPVSVAQSNARDNDRDLLGLGRMLAMDQDEALNYIISNVTATSSETESDIIERRIFHDIEVVLPRVEAEISEGPSDVDVRPPPPESLDELVPITEKLPPEEDSDDPPGRSPYDIGSPTSRSSLSLSDFDREPAYTEMFRKLKEEFKIDTDDSTAIVETKNAVVDDQNDISPDCLGFEMVDSEPTSFFDAAELERLKSTLGKLSREKGLDAQCYQCANCGNVLRTVGNGPFEGKVCNFTGKYYCGNCIHPDVFIIPAKVIHNWDFKRYTVSKRVAEFLLEFQHHPLLHVKEINPQIYKGVDMMKRLLVLRIKLNSLKNYLFSCREPVIKELQKQVWPREYLYEKIHVYSVSDLAQISNKSFLCHLQKVVLFAQNHVKDCWLCSQKGFICEICKNPQILYPFNIESIYRCKNCFSVYHKTCMTDSDPCPKCERKRKKQGASLVNAVHLNT